MLQNIRKTSRVELFCSVTAHLLSQPSAGERKQNSCCFCLGFKSTYIACGHSQETFYIMGFEIYSYFQPLSYLQLNYVKCLWV